MKYELVSTDELAKSVYNLSRLNFGREDSEFKVLKDFIQNCVESRAISVCVESFTDEKSGKDYDRGFVRGIYEILRLLEKSVDKGARLYFPERQDSPRMV